MLLHFEVTVAVAEPLTGTTDGVVLPLPLGARLGKPERCLPPWDQREAQEGTQRCAPGPPRLHPGAPPAPALAAEKSAEAVITCLALCSSVLWGTAGSDPNSH